MTEEAAHSATFGAAQPAGPPPTATAPGGSPRAGSWGSPDTAAAAGGQPPPADGAQSPLGGAQPQFGGAGFTSRYGLVRPRDGRYLAGVCAAIGRATNTDPVLWRVLLAVLGFFGGIGILVYVTAWLIIPGEGDSASPVESMLGRGRASMSPVTVIVLSILVATIFAYIVTDAFRAVLLGATILVGGALLLNRDNRSAQGGPVDPVPPGASPARPGAVPPVGHPAPTAYAVPPTVAVPPTGPVPPPPVAGVHAAWSAPVPERQAEPTAELPAWPPAVPTPPDRPPTGTSGASWSPATPTSGWPAATHPTPGPGHPPPAPRPPNYRPPFAPHGPYAGQRLVPPKPPVKPPKPPKPPRERSPLGPVTFSLIFLALGAVTVVDLLDAFDVGASAYFAATLAIIGLGLLVGTWFGRARWLIALGLVAAAALGVATVAESYDRIRGVDGNVTWAPTNHRDLALRYENSFGDTVLDLRAVDFDKKNTEITVSVNFGDCTVVVPPNVDVTTVADVNAGDAVVFDKSSGGLAGEPREASDLGPDGPGGGTLRLYVHVNAGNLEVTR